MWAPGDNTLQDSRAVLQDCRAGNWRKRRRLARRWSMRPSPPPMRWMASAPLAVQAWRASSVSVKSLSRGAGIQPETRAAAVCSGLRESPSPTTKWGVLPQPIIFSRPLSAATRRSHSSRRSLISKSAGPAPPVITAAVMGPFYQPGKVWTRIS